MFAELLKSFLRHQGSAAAGAVVGIGVATQDDATVFVNVAIGLLIYAASQGWSWFRKIQRGKAAKPA